MPCDELRLSAYIDNELTDTERAELEAHLETCADCSDTLAQYKGVTAMMNQVQSEPRSAIRQNVARRIRRATMTARLKNGMLVAAVAAVVVLAVMLWYSAPLDDGTAPGIVAQPETPTENTEVPAPQDDVPVALASAETPTLEERLDEMIELIGTTAGRDASAVIRFTKDDRQGVYRLGQTVFSDVRLEDVGTDWALFANDNDSVRLALGNSSSDPIHSIEGWWKITFELDGRGDGTFSALLQAKAQSDGSVFWAQMGPEEKEDFEVTLSNQHMSFCVAEYLLFEADLSYDRRSFQGDVYIKDTLEGEYELAGICLGEYMSDDDAATYERALVAGRRRKEVQVLAQAVIAAAKENDWMLPDVHQFEDIVEELRGAQQSPNTEPADEEQEASIEGDDEPRPEIVYLAAGFEIPDKKTAQRPRYQQLKSGAEYADALIAYESTLHRLYEPTGILGKPMLRVEYKKPAMVFAASTAGVVYEEADAPVLTEEQQRQMRAACANNLKQCGLVAKMFAAEHDGHWPPGWYMTYPDYIGDLQIMSCPTTDPYEENYPLLMPDFHEQDTPTTYLPDEEPQLAKALIPVVIATCRHPLPDGTYGTNVLFMDGHVEFWRESELNKPPYTEWRAIAAGK